MKGCALCQLELPSLPICEGDHFFCCPGCQAVFNILSSKGQLENFAENPIFKQAVNAGLISNRFLLETISSKTPLEGHLEKLYLEVQEMWCPSCAEIIKLLLVQEKGVKNCVVDYTTDLASVEYSPRYISKEKIIALIQSFGYKANFFQNAQGKKVSFDLYLRFIVAAFFSLNIMMFAYPLYATYFNYDEEGVGSLFAWLSFYASLPVVIYSGWPILKRFWLTLRIGMPGMETLVVLGVLASFALSLFELLNGGTKVYFDSMTVIIAFVLLGKIIEAKAKFSAKDALLRLSRGLPRRGRKRLANGELVFTPLKEIRPGDIIVVFTGEKIVLDGKVLEGGGACDESLMTGEALPIPKHVGDPVLGGTFLQSGTLTFTVTSSQEESALQRIIQMVERDIGQKTHYTRAVDPIIRWFVPIVLTLATLTALYHHSAIEAISVLLISCPCAIGIAAPLAESHLMNSLAKIGVLVRNRGCLVHLGRETLLVFDKTGTLTEGKFAVLKGLENLGEIDRSCLKGLVQQSTHPIAKALTDSSIPTPLDKVEEIAGHGMKGLYNTHTYFLGSLNFLKQHGIDCPLPEYPNLSLPITTVYFGRDKTHLTTIYLGDQLRKEAPEVIQKIKPTETMLLSGDGEISVKVTAELCQIPTYLHSCNPLKKREVIENLRKQGKIVCMIGDGINDAPSLTAAHVGISVVSASDISIQVSDILLTTERLEVIPQLRSLARKGRKIIRQNLFWAFFYNVVGIPLAAAGWLSPIFAAFAMVASSLMVLFNASRLIKKDLPT